MYFFDFILLNDVVEEYKVYKMIVMLVCGFIGISG